MTHSRLLYLQLFPPDVDLLQGSGILHWQVHIRNGKLMGQIIHQLYSIFHGGDFFFE